MKRWAATLFLCVVSGVFTLIWLKCMVLLPATEGDGTDVVAGTWSQRSTSGKLPMWRSLLSSQWKQLAGSGHLSFAAHSEQNLEKQKSICVTDVKSSNGEKYLNVQYFPDSNGLVTDTLRSISDLGTATLRKVLQPAVLDGHLVSQGIARGNPQAQSLTDLIDVERFDSAFLYSTSTLTPCSDGWDVLVAFLLHPLDDREKPRFTHPFARDSQAVDTAVSVSVASDNISSTSWDCTDHFKDILDRDSSLGMRCGARQAVICVDGSRLGSLLTLEQSVFSNATCVNVLTWCGRHHHAGLAFIGQNAPQVGSSAFYKSKANTLSRQLRNRASLFKAMHLGMSFMAIHCNLVGFALNSNLTINAMRTFADMAVDQARKLLESEKSIEVFIVTDIPSWEKVPNPNKDHIRALQAAHWIADGLMRAVHPVAMGSDENYSVRQLIEHELLVSADYLISVGPGTAVERVIADHDSRHPKYGSTAKLRWHFKP